MLNYMRASTPSGELMDFGNLPDYWRAIDELFKTLESLPDLAANHLLSSRAFDESQPAGRRAYMGVARYLGVARDNHEALLALLRHHGATPWAPWSLLRPVFEASFLAAWILDPDEGRERRARGLRCEVLDAHEQRKHRDAFRGLPGMADLIDRSDQQMNDGSMKTYMTEAASFSKKPDWFKQRINVVNELPRLSFVRRQAAIAPFLEATWRQLSGLEHGFGWAVLSATDRTVRAEVPGGVEVSLVINDESFVRAAHSTYLLLLTAGRLLAKRHTEPSCA